jgi:hypothetical protein
MIDARSGGAAGAFVSSIGIGSADTLLKRAPNFNTGGTLFGSRRRRVGIQDSMIIKAASPKRV